MQLDINQIKEILPHRYPFLLVDRILEITDTTVTGLKNVTANEEFFQGHFPGQPIMPGVLMIEAMAQVGGVMGLKNPELKGGIAFFAGVDGVKWKKPVTPGDQVIFKVEIKKMRLPLMVCSGVATVGNDVVCEIAELKLMLAPQKKEG